MKILSNSSTSRITVPEQILQRKLLVVRTVLSVACPAKLTLAQMKQL